MRKMSVLMIVGMLLAVAVPVQAADELWVSIPANRGLARFDATSGAFIDWAARPEGYDTSSPLRAPQGLTYTGGYVYVTSWNSDEIFKFDPAGAYGSWSVFASGAGIDGPRDLVLGPDGNFYVTSDGQEGVVQVAADGTIIGKFTSGDVVPMTIPSGVAFDGNGDLYVSQYDRNGTRNAGFVAKYDGSTGVYLGNVLEARDDTPIDYAHIKDVISYGDNIYAPVDQPWGQVYKVPTDVANIRPPDLGTVFAGSVFADRLGQGLNHITFGPDGNIYIADASDGWVGITSYDGTTGAIIYGGGSDKGQPEPFIDIAALGYSSSPVGLVFVHEETPPVHNPGDVDGDDFVGGADLTKILDNWGMSPADWADGDIAPFDAGDDFIGGADYTAVLDTWGTQYGPEPVPEPATLGLVLLGGLLALRRTR